MLPMKVSAMATSTGDWLSRAMVVGGALTAVDILLPPSRTDQYCNHKSKSPARLWRVQPRALRRTEAARQNIAMCDSNEARPPLPPALGGSADARDLVLAAADG